VPDNLTARCWPVRGGGTGTEGGPEHQQEPERPGRRDLGEGFPAGSRSLPELHPDVSAAGMLCLCVFITSVSLL